MGDRGQSGAVAGSIGAARKPPAVSGPVVLALFAALAWGASDYGAAIKSRGLSVLVVTGGMLLVAGLLAGIALSVRHGRLDPATVWLSMAASLITIVGLTALYRALAVGQMSVVAPISATGVGIPVLIGALTGTRPTWLQATGIVVALTGMFMTVRSATPTSGSASSRTAVLLAVLSAIGLGGFYVIESRVREGQALWFVALSETLAGLVLMGAWLCSGRSERVPRRAVLEIGVLGAVSLAAWLLTTLALSRGPLSLTATITALYPVVTVGLSICIGRERPGNVQLAGIAAVFVGIGAIVV